MRDYYIVCLRYGNKDELLFWKPERCGYTTIVEDAGLYTAEEAEKICADIEDVAVSRETIDALASRVVKRIATVDAVINKASKEGTIANPEDYELINKLVRASES